MHRGDLSATTKQHSDMAQPRCSHPQQQRVSLQRSIAADQGSDPALNNSWQRGIDTGMESGNEKNGETLRGGQRGIGKEKARERQTRGERGRQEEITEKEVRTGHGVRGKETERQRGRRREEEYDRGR